MPREYCFCTLALGKTYRACALILARDLELYDRNAELIILTDLPQIFAGRSNVRAFQYNPVSCKFYNDKRLVLAKALSLYNSCIFVDANVRIKSEIPENLTFDAGIEAHRSYALVKGLAQQGKGDIDREKYQNANKMFQLAQRVATYYRVDLNSVRFVVESIFYVSKNDRCDEFIKLWAILADYFESNGIYQGEGTIIGLAAAAADFPVYCDRGEKINLFKDVIERRKIGMGVGNYEENRQYFAELEKIEKNESSPIIKIWQKIVRKLGFYSRLSRLKLRISQYNDLFASFDRIETIELKDLKLD